MHYSPNMHTLDYHRHNAMGETRTAIDLRNATCCNILNNLMALCCLLAWSNRHEAEILTAANQHVDAAIARVST